MADYSVFTSESVSEGHPDKMADQISDAVLDAMLEWHPQHFHVALFPSQYRQHGSEILESGERTHYQVTRGDTLWKIAKRHNTDVLAVKEMNGLRSSRIYEGQVLRLPVSGRR